MIEKKHWEKFYAEKKAPTEPSDFAKYCGKAFKRMTILDVGSGNGRDSLHLAKKNIVISVDPTGEPYKKHKAVSHFKWSVDRFMKTYSADGIDLLYSRFFIHAIPKKQVQNIIEWAPQWFVAEFRIKGDEPVLYKNHKRYYWEVSEFLKLFGNGWRFILVTEGKGYAQYKDENPLVCRIIARRK